MNSDEEDTRSVSDKRIQTNEELLYDPSLDDRNEKWVQKKRKNYLQPGNCLLRAILDLHYATISKPLLFFALYWKN